MPQVVLLHRAEVAEQTLAGRPVRAHWSALLREAGLRDASEAQPGPMVVIDARYPAISAVHLRALAGLLATAEDQPAPGGALLSPDGTPLAVAWPHADPAEGAALLRHPGGHRLTASSAEACRIDDPWSHSQAERAIVDGVLRRLAAVGVRLVDPARIWVEPGVRVAPGATLWGGCTLLGATRIGPEAEVHAGAWLHDTVVGPASVIKPHTVCESARIGEGCSVGPSAHLRPGAVLEGDVKVGNFVEVKKAVLRRGVRASHLTYLGDAEIGSRANIGAGTITCNYDGHGKHRTVIGEGAFIGSNSSLVAPIEIGAGAIVGAGSTLSRSVPADSLAVERAEERLLEGRAPRIHERNRRLAEEAKRRE